MWNASFSLTYVALFLIVYAAPDSALILPFHEPEFQPTLSSPNHHHHVSVRFARIASFLQPR